MSVDFDPLRRVASRLDLDAIALVPGANFSRWLRVDFHQHERPIVVMIPRDGPSAAVVPSLERAVLEAAGFEGAVLDWTDAEGPVAAFDALLRRVPASRLGVEGQTMRVFVLKALEAAAPGLVTIDADAEISALRQRKSAAELDALRRAVAVSETALQDTLETVCVGDTEQAVRGRLLGALYRAGAEGLSFPPIVAAGANAANPHANSRADYAIRAGDVLLFDLGAVVDGLCADITRTVYVGHVSDEQRAVHETVLAANRAAIDAVRPGIPAGRIDQVATEVLERSAYTAGIRHRTGHGLGREVHEAPWIVRGNDTVLVPDMVFTVEPGLYLPERFGVRIEDDVLVTETGSESLTTFDRSPRVVATA